MPRSIVRRGQWSARAPKQTPIEVPLSARTATTIHHDGDTPIVVKTFAQACQQVRNDQDFHMDSRDWNDIGYNFLVISAPGYPEIDGMIMEGRGRDILGAHCLNHNTPWIGIQVAIGGGQKPSPAALSSTRWLHDEIALDADRSLGKTVHSDGFPTACPDEALRTWVRAGMPVGSPAVVAVKTAVVLAAKAVRKAPSRVVARITRVTLVVDGDFGPKTRDRFAAWAGVNLPEFGVLRPTAWAAIQRKVGAPADGRPGPKTWAAIQRLVDPRIGVGPPGPKTYRALQIYLNRH